MTQLEQATKLALEHVAQESVESHDGLRKAITVLRSALEQPTQQEQGDSICQEDDGCPTELAVLQRFWRGQPIPDEHYPAWFKPAQQEPVAWLDDEKQVIYGLLAMAHLNLRQHLQYGFCPSTAKSTLISVGKYAPELLAKMEQMDANPKREWQGLTDKELDDLWVLHHDHLGQPKTSAQNGWAYERAIEAKLKEKNHG